MQRELRRDRRGDTESERERHHRETTLNRGVLQDSLQVERDEDRHTHHDHAGEEDGDQSGDTTGVVEENERQDRVTRTTLDYDERHESETTEDERGDDDRTAPTVGTLVHREHQQ